MDEIEEPVIVTRDRDGHHPKREYGIAEIVPANKEPGGGIRDRSHLIVFEVNPRNAVAFFVSTNMFRRRASCQRAKLR
jgi:hypothetical protein